MTIELFKQYKCKGFYKKVYDGTFVTLDKKELSADWMNSDYKKYKDCIVEEDIDRAEKIYYSHVSQRFSGVVVGFTELVTEGYLDVVYEDAVDVGVGTIPEKFYVAKTPKTTIKCAIVYYANNKKHYVPIEDFEENNQ